MRLVLTNHHRSPQKDSPVAATHWGAPPGRTEVHPTKLDSRHFEQTARETSSRELGSWKEIAAYLNRTIRTAQRWERLERLPVRRHIHRRASTVFAYKAEIDAWLKKRTSSESTDREALGSVGSDLSIVTLKELLKILVLGLELLDSKLNQRASERTSQKDEGLQFFSQPAAVRQGSGRPLHRSAE